MEQSTKNIFKYPLVIGFLLLLFLPGVNGILGIWKFDRASENRTFTDSLSIDINHLDLFPEDAENYVNDNFSFRTPLLDFFHEMKFYVFNTSPHPDKLVVGKNGWYFMAGKELDNYTGEHSFHEDTLSLILEEWKERKDYFEQKGIKVYWLIAPTAHHVYSEHLPFNIRPSEERRVNQLKNYLEDDCPNLIIDPLPTLIKNRNNQQLYYKQDNHWNFRAGQLISELLIKRLRKDFPQYSIPISKNVLWNDSLVFDGIHHKVLGIKTKGEIREIPLIRQKKSNEAAKYSFPVTPGFPYSWEFERRFVNESLKNGLRIVVIRDSFGEQIMPFMSESFSESVFIFDSWKYGLNENVIDEVQPDIVIFLCVETFMENCISQN